MYILIYMYICTHTRTHTRARVHTQCRLQPSWRVTNYSTSSTFLWYSREMHYSCAHVCMEC